MATRLIFMATRLIFFLLVSYPLWITVRAAQVGLEEADSFVSVFGSFLKPRPSIVLEVPCKGTKRSVFVIVEAGGEEGERHVVGRIEEGATVCPSDDSHRVTFNIDQTSPESTTPVGFVGGHDNGRKREGPGGGGSGPGGGGDGPDGDDSGSGGRTNGDEENLSLDEEKFRRDESTKLAKISIVITAQTATSLMGFPKEKASTPLKYVLYFAVGLDMCAYTFCLMAVLLRRKKPFEASIMTIIGTSCSGFGFLLAMCLIVPSNFLWVMLVASFVMLSSVSILFISYN